MKRIRSWAAKTLTATITVVALAGFLALICFGGVKPKPEIESSSIIKIQDSDGTEIGVIQLAGGHTAVLGD